jgi:TolA-binding protein
MRGLLVAAVVPVLVGAGLLFRHVVRPVPLGYRVENGFVDTLQSVHENGVNAPILRFSDGTEVRLAEGAKARIRFVTPNGAAVAMDRGGLHADVVHSAVSEWRFDAGPFTVRVTGTSFGLDWQPEQDRFDLRLEHGSVTVTAPVANDPIPVRAGQWLTIRPRSNEVMIRDLTANASGAGSSYVDEAYSPRLPDSGLASPSPADNEDHKRPAGATETPRSWASDLSHGKLELIIKDAQSRGLEDCLAKVSSDELSALADAARYTRHSDIARKALLAQRHRFPGLRKATEAAFLLGKLEEAGQNQAGAIGYFDAYLAEAPSGTYASEALGRKMAIVQHSSGSLNARPFAQDYLAKYPNGTYASAAQAILQNP